MLIFFSIISVFMFGISFGVGIMMLKTKRVKGTNEHLLDENAQFFELSVEGSRSRIFLDKLLHEVVSSDQSKPVFDLLTLLLKELNKIDDNDISEKYRVEALGYLRTIEIVMENLTSGEDLLSVMRCLAEVKRIATDSINLGLQHSAENVISLPRFRVAG